MDFTVLLPIYHKDSSEYLKIAIDSLLDQSFKPKEILILVDGPVGDELKTLLMDYKSKYDCVNVIFFQENRGLGKVLMDGVNLAKYEIIARMDADDVSVQDRFENQLKYFLENKELAIVGGNIQEYSNDFSEKLNERKVPTSLEEIKSYSKLRNPFNHMTVMFKKSVILEAGNYTEMPLFEDYYLWCRVLKNGHNGLNINKVLVKARAGEDMVQRRSGLSYFKKEIGFQKALLQLGYTNMYEFIRNLIIRGLPRILPKKMLLNIYNNILRK